MSLFFPSVKETSISIPQIDDDEHLYRGLGTAPRDLLGTTLTRAMNLSVALYRGNPIANRLIKIITSFLAGDGFSIEAKNPEVGAVLDEFWLSERNQMQRRHKWYARDWLLFGEGVHPVKADEAGNTTLGFIDPTTVVKVSREATNNMILTHVHVNKGLTTAETVPLEIVKTNDDLLEPGAGLLAGEVFFFPFERIAAATRGMPFLMPSLDWLDAYDQILWEHTERIKAIRAFFWDVEVQGGKRELIEAKEQWGLAPPKSGSVRYRTSAMKVKAESPNLGAAEDVKSMTYILRHIATGGSVAPHWLGEPEDANRSTAEAMDVPVLRGLTDVQNDWKLNVTDMCRFAVDAKVTVGMLPRVLPEIKRDGTAGELFPARELFEIVVPEIAGKKVSEAATSLAAVASAMVQLDMVGALGPELAQLVVRHMMPQLGIPVDELPQEDAAMAVSALRAMAGEEGEELEEVWREAISRAM